ncbi:MAG: hypothetical protein IJ640_00305 [Prevotella sp.]|nr:hypothetical protein [Prevotella sp.]
MSQTVATPANLNEFAQSLGTRLAQEAGGGSGDSNFVYVESFVKKEEGVPHIYLVVDSSISLEDVSLRFGRKGRTHCRRSDKSPYHNNADVPKAHTVGWHQVWRLPLHTTKTPLIVPVLKSLTPAFTIGDNAYYEITVSGYQNLYEFLTDDEFVTGYKNRDNDPLPVSQILSHPCGVCLVRDGKQISNWAGFRALYREDDDMWCLGK